MAVQLWSTFSAPTLFTAANYVGKGGANSGNIGSAAAMPDGINVMTAIFSTVGTTVTISISDVVVMGMIPEGSVIVAGSLVGTGGATATGVKVGLGAAGTFSSTGQALDGVLLAATNLTTTRSVTQFGVAGGLPFKVAAIAAATYPKVYPVICTLASGSLCISTCFSVNLIYMTATSLSTP